MRTSRDESAVSTHGSFAADEPRGANGSGVADMNHPAAVFLRWAWRLINFRSLARAGFRPEEDSGSLDGVAGAQWAAGSTVVDSNERAFADCNGCVLLFFWMR